MMDSLTKSHSENFLYNESTVHEYYNEQPFTKEMLRIPRGPSGSLAHRIRSIN